ncbi:OmpA family protein [Methylovulum psychrotolerans]|jgi:outer membrane protein OmpA-like peptidoglycan-associated protein|uniref:Flagellar motor protein MotB n=1 Tax=Methylovulum psychrotolerans TaxID=1704499 RepID=A0A1Z4C1C6_9GAMM|nr:OmpA family protein [Methylovulum psychrotolerans]ASF47310.1 flagellar motor protein MotB [Methylovulum psychrotolerans]
MQNHHFFPLSLIAVALLSGCGSVPNPALDAAHSNFNTARSDADVTSLAALELQTAGESLTKADTAFANDEDAGTVNQLAYLTTQQVNIAQEVANRKTAELVVTNAAANRNAVRLDARTAEIDRDHALIAEQQRQLDALNAKKTDRGMVITLSDVLFNVDKAQLKSGGVRNVQKLADFLSQYPNYKVSVEGHTDSTGSDEHNQDLSERRADSVQSALLNDGIGGERISTHGYGEGSPIASNDDAGSRQLNRRVEIILSDANGNITQR